MLVLKLSDLETPTVDYICFQMVPLLSILLSYVSYKIRLKIGLFISFYPQFGRFGLAGPDSNIGTNKYTNYYTTISAPIYILLFLSLQTKNVNRKSKKLEGHVD